jgi:hypothetical protein
LVTVFGIEGDGVSRKNPIQAAIVDHTPSIHPVPVYACILRDNRRLAGRKLSEFTSCHPATRDGSFGKSSISSL